MLNRFRFRFLNREDAVSQPEDWNDPDKPKLWLYHLHYFDDLNADRAEDRRAQHRDLIRRWIDENPPGGGVGWEPYPTSLRIVNWIKWALRERGGVLWDSAVHSLAIQVRWLERRIEYHVLGNHLLANVKALIFAGLYFDGEEAERWYRKGKDLLESEIEEQCLEDGGHFERSAMYHALVLEDLLDLINLYQCYDRDLPDRLRPTALAMETWLHVMRHPDGDIPFFNDATFGTAPTPVQLDQYADRLLEAPRADVQFPEQPVHDLPATGYTRVEIGPVVAFLDIAPIGPDYLPAHAHADTLSFELSIGRQRLFVNSGTSTYERGPRREWERGTPAHNTVTVDGEDSSEVWSSFRVARRARVTERRVEASNGVLRVTGAHDGYRRLHGEPVHRRTWQFAADGIEILDRLDGSGRHRVDLWYHLHPSWSVSRAMDSRVVVMERDGSWKCELRFEGAGSLEVSKSEYASEFGQVEPAEALCYRVDQVGLPLTVRTRLTWTEDPRPGA